MHMLDSEPMLETPVTAKPTRARTLRVVVLLVLAGIATRRDTGMAIRGSTADERDWCRAGAASARRSLPA